MNSEELLLERSEIYLSSPDSFCVGGEGKKGLEAGEIKAMTAFLSLEDLSHLQDINIQTSQASIIGLTELLARECTIDW